MNGLSLYWQSRFFYFVEILVEPKKTVQTPAENILIRLSIHLK